MIDIITLIAYLVSTFAFCLGFTNLCFSFLNKSYDNNKKTTYTFLFFLINSLSFIVCWKFSLGITINWLIFMMIAFIETFFILKAKFSSAAFLSIFVSLYGLNINIFQRAILAIIINIPLSSIDTINSNFPAFSIIISFFICYIIFMNYSKEKRVKPLRHILQTPKHLNSLLSTMGILMAYLLLQKLLYISDNNSIFIKLWSLLSCVYILFGFLWSIKYAVRFSYLYYLDDQNVTLRRILHDYKAQEANLKEVSNYDLLTEVLNRRAGDNALKELYKNNVEFCLCIIDLDGLKYVNDNLGHKYGDIYLKSISNILKESCRNNKDILFRYGGDEFVLVFVEMSTYDVNVRMQYIFNEVLKLSEKSDFPMNISYGISPNSEFTLQQRFEQADKYMYEMKAEHKKRNPNIVRN